jgi:hypothetical protein
VPPRRTAMKIFNTAGPVNRPFHYKVDPLTRWDFEEIMELISTEKYFLLHAPRQTGKTSCLLALQDYLNDKGEHFALYINVEGGQAARHQAKDVIEGIVNVIETALAELNTCQEILDNLRKISEKSNYSAGLFNALSYLSTAIDKPFVLFIDEIDALVGDSLISVLRQIRSGYGKRPGNFPSTVVLCGVRDIKDYRIHTSGQDIITGGSAFNIKVKSLRLGDFSKDDVINLYSQHTAETGQVFEEGCFDLVMDYTAGQPWLVNALAHQVTSEMKENRDRSVVITTEKLADAKEELILARQTHLDQLVDKLGEPRVYNVIAPMILGVEATPNPRDVEYCVDLGLIKRDRQGIRIANRIYQEIIPRVLTEAAQTYFYTVIKPDWLNPDGSLCMATMLTMFKDFWNQNREIWGTTTEGYLEAAPQLLLQAFLQRVVNGGGTVEREYAIGRQRSDLMIKWRYDHEGKTHYQHIILELKTIDKHKGYEKTLTEGLAQTAEYAYKCGQKDAYLLIFDKDDSQKWPPDEPNEGFVENGVSIEVWKFRQALKMSPR